MNDDFERETVQRLADYEKRLRRLEAVPVGPPLGELVADMLLLPGLRGLWQPGSSVDNTGAVYDQSGQGRTLTYNGNPTIHITNSLVPYFDYDGTGDFHSRADEAGLDLLGTETYLTSSLRGLSVGGWFRTSLTSGQNVMTKGGGTAATTNFLLQSSTNWAFAIANGGTQFTVNGSANTVNAWTFVVGRFTPSTELAVFVNGTKTTNVTSIPASANNSAAPFNIAGINNSAGYTGHCAAAFLSAAALTDATISYLFSRTRAFFGV